jgi:Fe-S-cluster-containing dehydrogenase component/DMSO reductase anchor subunit
MNHKAFVFDLNRCTGCNACELACTIENELEPGMSWRQIVTFNASRLPGVPLFSLSLACNHCLDAPCKEKCPALAYSKDDGTGAVTVNPSLCMGCRYCQWVCPYDAPKFNKNTGVIEKCTFCSHRLKDELDPACTTACPTAALRFESYSFEEAQEQAEIPGFWKTHITPAIHIEPLRRGTRPPQMHHSHSFSEMPRVANGSLSNLKSRVSLASEWPLLVFTLTAAVLVALFHSWIVATQPVPLIPFTLAGIVAMGLSTIHLGKPSRFYRAVLNWRRSWISREVLLFSAFFGGALYFFNCTPFDTLMGRLVAAAGFAALFAMDKVYQVPTNMSTMGLHSASVLLTGVYLVGVFTQHPWFLFPLAGAKLVLYLVRGLPTIHKKPIYRLGLFGLRIATGFVFPVLIWVLTGKETYSFVVASIFAGEVVDRAEFYMDLDFTRPETRAHHDLERLIEAKPLILS